MAKSAQHTARALVIVESPSKARTINKYLGPDYIVLASMGHVRDLPPNEIGVDLEGSFEPIYEVLADKKKVVNQLKKAAKGATEIYLATDLDREGEAIAWHLVHALGLDVAKAKRVMFNEITRSAIQEAFRNPQRLDMDKVNAQQARRILDRVVGYQLSPLLQRKISKGLSAGRVQSVTVRLVVDREREIRSFDPVESWRVGGCFSADPSKAAALGETWRKFLESGGSKSKKGSDGPTVKERNAWLAKHDCLTAELVQIDGKAAKLRSVDDARRIAEAIGVEVERVDREPFEPYTDQGLEKIRIVGGFRPDQAPQAVVEEILRKRTTSRPGPPLTTAALQQAASSELGFPPSRTMRLAQQLYEGVDLGGGDGPVGLITYMRTDSVNLSKDSVATARDLIGERFGAKYLPKSPNVFGKAKRAQEAHEAIRPTDARLAPDALKGHLTGPQQRLYDLIWRRFVACQMTPALWDSSTILIKMKTADIEAQFKATGRQLAFDGYLRVAGIRAGGDVVLPALAEGAALGTVDVDPRQLFTAPPARYTEASLVKKLESEGIGRPSTYAAIIQTIQDRAYVELTDRNLHPTHLGEMVTDKLVEHFPGIMDLKFTSYMEDELDKIEESHLDWVHVLREFYDPFKAALDKAEVHMVKAGPEPSEYTCTECGKAMVYRDGRNGRFLSCSGYPDCKVSRNIDKDGKIVAEVHVEEDCRECGKAMKFKTSRMGPFLGCSGYPDCTFTMPCSDEGVALRKVEADEVKETCEECHSSMEVKWSRGKSFLGCSRYPKCKSTKPLPEGVYVEKPKPIDAGVRCDKCGRDMVIRTSKRGPFLSCSGFPRCRNAMPKEKIDHLKQLLADGKIPDPPPPSAGRGKGKSTAHLPKTAEGKIDIAAMGPPPTGFAWTRTGRPVVETWPEDDELTCPDCGKEMRLKTGRFGPFWGCTKHPKCSFIANMRGEAKKRAEAENPTPPKPKPIPTEVPCEECGEPMWIRTGRTGPFLGCSKYPKCKATKPMPEGATTESLAAAPAK